MQRAQNCYENLLLAKCAQCKCSIAEGLLLGHLRNLYMSVSLLSGLVVCGWSKRAVIAFTPADFAEAGCRGVVRSLVAWHLLLPLHNLANVLSRTALERSTTHALALTLELVVREEIAQLLRLHTELFYLF